VSKFAILWYWQKERLSADWFETYSYETDEFPCPSLTRQGKPPTNAEPWSWTSLDENNRLVVHLPKDHIPDAPSLWYVLIREYGQRKQTQTLAAFDTDHYPDGTVVEIDELKRKGFEPSFMANRIAALRWGFGDPHLEQLFVAETHRRKRISIKLINVADIVNIAGNWGGFIYGGDQVTDMGAQLGESWSGSNRLKPVEVRLPPMNI
jgi:hypothetical protein